MVLFPVFGLPLIVEFVATGKTFLVIMNIKSPVFVASGKTFRVTNFFFFFFLSKRKKNKIKELKKKKRKPFQNR
jgi:hypothetical protein